MAVNNTLHGGKTDPSSLVIFYPMKSLKDAEELVDVAPFLLTSLGKCVSFAHIETCPPR